MRPAEFNYHAPKTLEEAFSLLSQLGDDAQILAGGQSLIPAMNLRLARPKTLVDISKIENLNRIETNGNQIRIGALVTHSEIGSSVPLANKLTLFKDVSWHISHPSVRNKGTFGGSLANADPAAEWPSVLVALKGEVSVSSSRGNRTINANDFFRSFFTTTLEPDEIIVGASVSLPEDYERWTWGFSEVARQSGAFGIVLVVVGVSINSERGFSDMTIVVGGCESTPVELKVDDVVSFGDEVSVATVDEIVQQIPSSITPMGDINATSEDRIQMIEVLVRRSLVRLFGLSG